MLPFSCLVSYSKHFMMPLLSTYFSLFFIADHSIKTFGSPHRLKAFNNAFLCGKFIVPRRQWKVVKWESASTLFCSVKLDGLYNSFHYFLLSTRSHFSPLNHITSRHNKSQHWFVNSELLMRRTFFLCNWKQLNNSILLANGRKLR